MLADLLCMMVETDVPGVVFVLPDSYIDPVNKEYGGQVFLLVIKICLFCSVVKLYLGYCVIRVGFLFYLFKLVLVLYFGSLVIAQVS